MTPNSFNIEDFAARLRLLISRTKEQKAKNAELSEIIRNKDEEIKTLKQKISEQEQKYNNLITAKMLNITDCNIDEVKKQINNLIRTVDNCITLLNEKQYR